MAIFSISSIFRTNDGVKSKYASIRSGKIMQVIDTQQTYAIFLPISKNAHLALKTLKNSIFALKKHKNSVHFIQNRRYFHPF